jgi:hypothetical protein
MHSFSGEVGEIRRALKLFNLQIKSRDSFLSKTSLL